jgi:hypothetical protein
MTFDELNNLKAVARKYGGLNLGEVDQLIATAERHLASAEQVRQMREALERLSQPSACGCKPCRGSCFSEQSLRIELEERMQIAMDALALTPSQAEQQARKNAEKAAKWGEAKQVALSLDAKLAESLKERVGFADKDFEIAVTLLGALLNAAFGKDIPENGLVCSAVLADGEEIFMEARRRSGEPYVKVAEEWREKADLLEWMFSTASISQDLLAPEFIDECVALIKSQAASPEDMEDILKWGMLALCNRKAAKEAPNAK